MNHQTGELNVRKPRILVAPLDWGLGHATRCIPIIRALLAHNADVWLAAEGMQAAILSQEFPDLPVLPLKGYRVQYAKSSVGLAFAMVKQYPRLRRTIRDENAWLSQMQHLHHFDGVISDNRYGLHIPAIPCIFITHQLHIKAPWKWLSRLLQKQNYRYINQFTECWIPDLPGPGNFAGLLSHPGKSPNIPLRYTGPLTRFKTKHTALTKNHLLIILSGPEPQRTLLENIIIRQIAHYLYTATVVRGLPGEKSIIPSTGMIRFFNHLGSEALQEEIEKAEIVVARSGYSSIMDLLSLGKKVIMIPTPGQTEQEYLANKLHEENRILKVNQKELLLEKHISLAKDLEYTEPEQADQLLGSVIDTFTSQF